MNIVSKVYTTLVYPSSLVDSYFFIKLQLQYLPSVYSCLRAFGQVPHPILVHNSYSHFKVLLKIISSWRTFLSLLIKWISLIKAHMSSCILPFFSSSLYTLLQLLMHLLNVHVFIINLFSLRGDAMFILFISVVVALNKELEYFRFLITVEWTMMEISIFQ